MTGKEDMYYTLIADEPKLSMKFNGVEITTVIPGGWAERNRVEVDDEIYEVGGQPFESMSRQEKLAALQAPRPISITFKRPAIKDSYYVVTLNEQKLGMGFKGAKVSSTQPGGWADRNGVFAGDEIAEIDGVGFNSLSDEAKVQAFKAPRPFDLKFKRPASVARRIDEVEAANKQTTAKPAAEKKSGGLFGIFSCCNNAEDSNEVTVNRKK